MFVLKKINLFCLSLLLCIGSMVLMVSESSAVLRLEECNKTTKGNGIDGSNCNFGLMCDVTHKVCVYGTESPCRAERDCMIGKRCYNKDGDAITSSGEVGICKEIVGAGMDDSPFTIIICKVIQVMTGPIAKVVVVVVVCWFAIQIGMGKTTVVQFSSLALSITLYVMAPKVSTWMLGGGAACI